MGVMGFNQDFPLHFPSTRGLRGLISIDESFSMYDKIECNGKKQEHWERCTYSQCSHMTSNALHSGPPGLQIHC